SSGPRPLVARHSNRRARHAVAFRGSRRRVPLSRSGYRSRCLMRRATAPTVAYHLGMTARGAESTISRVRPPRPGGGPPDARLSVVYPPALCGAIDLGASTLVAGRRPASEGPSLVLDHATVSRSHLAIEWEPRMRVHRARDLNSHNGSLVDGHALDTLR